MNLYEVLQVEKDADECAIKAAYRKLALIYHPDKNPGRDTSEQFKQIQMAYEILADREKRAKYDLLNESEQLQLYDNLKDWVSKEKPNWLKVLNFVSQNVYSDEDLFKKDINDLNLFNIYSKIKDSVQNIFTGPPDTQLNVIHKLEVSIEDKYKNKFITATVERRTKPPLRICVPCSEYTLQFEHDGETDGKSHGDLMIEMVTKPSERYTIDDHYNLIVKKEIRLSDYVYGFTYEADICGTTITVQVPSLIPHGNLYRVKGYGLPILDDEYNVSERGELHIHCTVIHIDGLKDRLIELENEIA